VIQKFVFEQKIEKKKKELLVVAQPKLTNDYQSSPLKLTPLKNHLINSVQNLEEKKFTPNRINYNYDVASPYFINITHRSKASKSKENSRVSDKEQDEAAGVTLPDGDDAEEELCNPNLFDLTEKNLREFSKNMSKVLIVDRLAIRKRNSYISQWKEKIKQIRKNNNELDIKYINYLNTCNDVTLLDEIKGSQETSDDDKSSNETFVTAKSDLKVNPPQPAPQDCEFIEEDYIHSDDGVVFYEKRIISKSRHNLQSIDETDNDDAVSQSSVSTKLTLPRVEDYDTDTLRKELDRFGLKPGELLLLECCLILNLILQVPSQRVQRNFISSNWSNASAILRKLESKAAATLLVSQWNFNEQSTTTSICKKTLRASTSP